MHPTYFSLYISMFLVTFAAYVKHNSFNMWYLLNLFYVCAATATIVGTTLTPELDPPCPPGKGYVKGPDKDCYRAILGKDQASTISQIMGRFEMSNKI